MGRNQVFGEISAIHCHSCTCVKIKGLEFGLLNFLFHILSKLRQSYKQQQYREQSSSQHKRHQDVAHTLSIEMAEHIQSHAKGPADQESLLKLVNNPDNMRMVSRETNRKQHREIDQAIIAKSGTSAKLTNREELRVRQQVFQVQKHSQDCPPGFKEAAKDFYKGCRTQDGKTLWDGRRDKSKRP